MGKKLKIDKLKVTSFITKKAEVRGGDSYDTGCNCIPPDPTVVDTCSCDTKQQPGCTCGGVPMMF